MKSGRTLKQTLVALDDYQCANKFAQSNLRNEIGQIKNVRFHGLVTLFMERLLYSFVDLEKI